MKKIFLFLSLAAMQISYAQDIHFSQFYATPLLINPAQTALHSNARFILNYRNQWAAFGAPYQTYAFSGEMAINHKKTSNNWGGVGILFYDDKAGDSQMGIMEAALTGSGIIETDDNNRISGGMLVGYTQRSMNYSKLIWDDQYDGMNFNTGLSSGEPTGAANYHYFDLGGGVAWNYGKAEKYISANDGVRMTTGISAWHFGLPNYSFVASGEKLNTKLILHSIVEVGLANSNVILVPNLLVMKQGKLNEIDLGGQVKFVLKENSVYTGRIKASAIGFGVMYRNHDAIIPEFSYENSAYAFGFSYDANISRLKAATSMQGGFEVFLRYSADHLFTSQYSSEAMYN
ncbi:MAG TPA: PorP/SprF family type IX secretion system membrane protein [Bacteroidia bacterium]|jgi:type IX secretion system PorP/SprF family membrane protein|nr:PorP/SprF family type IX secretion system membrane protein [Bacteroidia bacterium]